MNDIHCLETALTLHHVEERMAQKQSSEPCLRLPGETDHHKDNHGLAGEEIQEPGMGLPPPSPGI